MSKKRHEKWIHNFTVSETQTHSRGYTIYKITSVIFPILRPEVLSCVTVWKRFSEVKRLHKTVAGRLREEDLRNARKMFPALVPDRKQYFWRFTTEVIEQRRQLIVALLDFIGEYPSLYSSAQFTNFLQGGHTPEKKSNVPIQVPVIDSICDSLDIPRFSDEATVDHRERSIRTHLTSESSSSSEATVTVATVNNESSQETHPKSPVRIIADIVRPATNSTDYFLEAAEKFNEAVQLEVNDHYTAAFDTYKLGIETLMRGIRTDTDESRKKLAKEKAAKYLTRSENLYDHFILPRHASQSTASDSRELPLGHLAKYKVMKILDDNVMSVQDVTTKRFYIIKSLDRPENMSTEYVLARRQVPYMAHLVAYFDTEFVIFLLLQPTCGGKLMDYITNYIPVIDEVVGENDDNNAIAPGANGNEGPEIGTESGVLCEEAQSAYETLLADDIEVKEILTTSQRLLDSVEDTLKQSKTATRYKTVANERVDRHVECSRDPYRIPEACVRQWAKELITGVQALHEQGIVLGDLTPDDNLLLGKSGQVMLTYFSYRIPTVFSVNERSLRSGYVAPDRPIEHQSDWWSVGVILYELLTGKKFRRFHSSMWYHFEVQYPDESEPDPYDERLSTDAISLLNGLIVEDPEARFTFDQICTHPFFAETDWSEIERKGATA